TDIFSPHLFFRRLRANRERVYSLWAQPIFDPRSTACSACERFCKYELACSISRFAAIREMQGWLCSSLQSIILSQLWPRSEGSAKASIPRRGAEQVSAAQLLPRWSAGDRKCKAIRAVARLHEAAARGKSGRNDKQG